MKKYLFAFVLFASFATVACDTSSKASTTQSLAPAPPVQAAVAAAPIALDTVISPMEAKKGYKKKKNNDMLQAAPMTPEEKHKMLRAEEKVLPKN